MLTTLFTTTISDFCNGTLSSAKSKSALQSASKLRNEVECNDGVLTMPIKQSKGLRQILYFMQGLT